MEGEHSGDCQTAQPVECREVGQSFALSCHVDELSCSGAHE